MMESTGEPRPTGRRVCVRGPAWSAAMCVLLGLLVCSESVAEDYSAPETSWFEDIPGITSATRLRQRPAEAPATITLIDRDMIRASGAVEIAELLLLVPGMQIGQGDTPTYSVTYHGQTDSFSRRIQVMVDGRPVYGPVYSSVDWHALGIDLDDIEQIEVVRGPSAAAFGENAFSAAINIITRQPFESRGWYVKATGGSLDTGKGYARYGGSLRDTDFRASLGYDHAEAFPDNNSEKIVRSADLRVHHNPDVRDQFELHAGVSAGPMGRGSGVLPDKPFDPYASRDINRNYQLLRWLHDTGQGGETRVQFYHNYFAENDSFTVGRLSDLLGIAPADVPNVLPVPSDQVIDFGIFNYKSDRVDAELQYSSPQLGAWRFVAGAGGRIDRFSSEYLTGPKGSEVEERLLRGFFNVEYRPQRAVIMNGGLMVEHGDLASTELSPRLGINYLLTDHHTLRANASRSMRAPSLLEEHFDLAVRANDGTALDVIHTSLPGGVDAESINAYELGYLGQWPERGLTLDLKLYRELIRDEIGERVDTAWPEPLSAVNPGAWVAYNGSRIDIDGFELQLGYRPDNATLLSLQYAYADADQELTPDSIKLLRDASGVPFNALDGTPLHTASLLLSRKFAGGWQASTLVSYLDEMGWYGDGGDVEAHTRVDLRLAREFRLPGSDALLEFIVHNLGEEHQVFDSDQLFDTRYYLRGSLQFR